MNSQLERAYNFVKERHKGQKRKFTNAEYVTHLRNTTNILFIENELAESDDFIAAMLHDVIEDTPTELKEIGQLFGNVVMDLVSELTTDEIEKTKKGKAVYLTEKINNMSERAFTIKLCDRLDNVMDLGNEGTPVKFIKHYVDETNYIIGHLDREIDTVQSRLITRIRSMLLYLKLTKIA